MSKVINVNEFNKEVENSRGVVVVDFFATWCGPCQMLAPVFESVGHKLEDKAKFLKVDIDESMEIARRYKVMSVPTMIVFKDGKAVEKLIGAMPEQSLLNKVGTHL